MISKRRDNKGRVLQQGEGQEPSGRYRYKYTDSLGKRKILYSWRLTESDKMPEGKRADSSLREKERKVQSLQMQGITFIPSGECCDQPFRWRWMMTFW